ncbi:hypothetical protein D3C87_2052730 [compost metagenome]
MVTVRHEQWERLVRQQILFSFTASVYVTKFLKQYVEVFRRKTGETDDRPRKIHESGFGKRVLSQSGLQGRVAK